MGDGPTFDQCGHDDTPLCRRFLVWDVAESCDGQGLSDRRACLAIVLAEAFLLGRVAVLPRFTLDAIRHNHGVQLPDRDLQDYISLEHIPIATIARDNFKFRTEDAVVAKGILDPCYWRTCSARVLVRPCVVGFWRNEVHDTVFHLAGELHGQGMKPTPGLFAPAPSVVRDAVKAKSCLGTYIGVHVRRGDKLDMMQCLDQGTCAEAVAAKVAAVAPPNIRNVYVARNDVAVDFAGSLASKGFHCFVAEDVFQKSEFREDNHLLFAMEMWLVDHADVSIRTFNDSTPWYYSPDCLRKAHHLVDRSMHDYVFGFSTMGAGHFCVKSPLALAAADPNQVYAALLEAGSERHSFLPIVGLPRLSTSGEDRCEASHIVTLYHQATPEAAISVPMVYAGQGVHIAKVDVRSEDVCFIILVDGCVRQQLYPKIRGKWPLLREVVTGPCATGGDQAWWFPGIGCFEIWLEACGRRAVTVWPISDEFFEAVD